MAAGTTSVDAKAVRVDSIGRGVETHKPHRATHIGVRFWDLEPRAAPVTNGEDRKSPVQERLEPRPGLLWGRPPRDPAAAHHVEDPDTVGIARWRENVKGQRHPVLMAIDHIRDDGAAVLCVDRDSQAERRQRRGRGSGQHSHGYSPAPTGSSVVPCSDTAKSTPGLRLTLPLGLKALLSAKLGRRVRRTTIGCMRRLVAGTRRFGVRRDLPYPRSTW